MLQLFSRKVLGYFPHVAINFALILHSLNINYDLMGKNLLVLYNLVLEEVESKVEMFRNQLRSRLSILPIPLKDMRRYIKYEFCASFSQQISE